MAHTTTEAITEPQSRRPSLVGGRRALACKGSGRDSHAGHGCRAGGEGAAETEGRGPIITGPPIRSGHFIVGKFAALHVVVLAPVPVHVELVRASWRVRVFQSVYISVVAVNIQKTNHSKRTLN